MQTDLYSPSLYNLIMHTYVQENFNVFFIIIIIIYISNMRMYYEI